MSSSSYVVFQQFPDTKTEEKSPSEEAGPVTRFKTRQRARWDNSRYDKAWRPEPVTPPGEGHFVATLLSQAWRSAAEGQQTRREAGLTSGSETDETSKGSQEKIPDAVVKSDDPNPLAQTLLALIGRRNGQHVLEGGVGPPEGPSEWGTSQGTGLGSGLCVSASNVQDIVTSLTTATQQVVQQQRLLISQFDDTLANFLSATFSDTTSPDNVSLVIEQQERILQQQVLALEIATHRYSMFRKQLASLATKKRGREIDCVKPEDECLTTSIKASPIVSAVASSSPPTAVVSTSPSGPSAASFNQADDCRISRSLPPSGVYWGNETSASAVYGMSDPEGSNVVETNNQTDTQGLGDLKSSFMFNNEELHSPTGAWNDVMGFKRKKNKGEKIHLANTTHYCSMCQSNMTPQWRYLSTQRFCNACYMRLKRSMASKGVTMQSLKRFAAASNHIIGAVSDVQREAASLTQAMLAPPLSESSVVHTVMSTPVEESRMVDQTIIPSVAPEGNNSTSHKAPAMYMSSNSSFCLEPGASNFLGGFTT